MAVVDARYAATAIAVWGGVRTCHAVGAAIGGRGARRTDPTSAGISGRTCMVGITFDAGRAIAVGGRGGAGRTLWAALGGCGAGLTSVGGRVAVLAQGTVGIQLAPDAGSRRSGAPLADRGRAWAGHTRGAAVAVVSAGLA